MGTNHRSAKGNVCVTEGETELAYAYLALNRCPYCIKRSDNPAKCGMTIKRTFEGWYCAGFSSRL